ncbi:MAG: NnrS family protein [Gammaproteobacteria bacterium]
MKIALFNLGFRPFFLAAGLYSLLAMIAWALIYQQGPGLPTVLPAIYWHGHEMIYGYGVAVLSGFLLTSVRNWTGIDTPRGTPLALLLGLWLAARISVWSGQLGWAMGADLLFSIGLLCGLIPPLVKTGQNNQTGLMALVTALLMSNQLFYLSALPEVSLALFADAGPTYFSANQTLLTGLYILIAIILLMIGRLLPAFTRMATQGKVVLAPLPALEKPLGFLIVGFILLAPHWITIPFAETAIAMISLLLALVHGYRLYFWRHREIAARPLLWVIYLAYLFMVLGFFARAAQSLGVPTMVATHCFAVGGVGLATLGLMARVALGHTGRDVYDPPKLNLPMIVLLLAGTLVRVATPLLFPRFYPQGVLIAQCLWIAAFGLFLLIYTPKLVSPRPDGKPG